MLHTQRDIQQLLTRATQDERTQLAELLGENPAGVPNCVWTPFDALKGSARINWWGSLSPQEQAAHLAKQLWWRYQTPLGYLTRDPSFEEVCVDVAKTLKLGGLADAEISCWTLLARLSRTILEQLLERMSPEQREAFAKDLFTPEQLREMQMAGGVDWGKVGAGTLLLALKQFGGFATYKVALIAANHMAKMLLGRGLTLAANAALTRVLSLALGPVGWLLLIWGINDLLGTSYKRLIPSVLFLSAIHARLQTDGGLPA